MFIQTLGWSKSESNKEILWQNKKEIIKIQYYIYVVNQIRKWKKQCDKPNTKNFWRKKCI